MHTCMEEKLWRQRWHNLVGSGGMLPQKIFKFRVLEMPFLAFSTGHFPQINMQDYAKVSCLLYSESPISSHEVQFFERKKGCFASQTDGKWFFLVAIEAELASRTLSCSTKHQVFTELTHFFHDSLADSSWDLSLCPLECDVFFFFNVLSCDWLFCLSALTLSTPYSFSSFARDRL